MSEPVSPLVHTDERALEESTACRVETGSTEPGPLSSVVERRVHIADVVGSTPTAATTRRRRKSAYVYFIHAPVARCVKIGMAVDPFERLGTLQTGNPEALTLLGAMCGYEDAQRLELEVYGILWAQGLHVRGEWFRAEPFAMAFVNEACNHDDYEPYQELQRLRMPPEPLIDPDWNPQRPTIPEGVAAPVGNTRKARMERYLLARGLSA